MSSELRWALERLMEAAELDDMPPGLAQARNQARKALDDAANVAEIYGANAAKAILALKAP